MTDAALLTLIPPGIRDPDLRQDIALALLQQKPQTEADAHTIIRRLGYRHDRDRSMGKRRSMPILGEPEACQSPQDAPGAIFDLLDTLPHPHRSILVLAYVDGLTDREMASRLGVTTRTIYRRKAAALIAAREAAALNGDVMVRPSPHTE